MKHCLLISIFFSFFFTSLAQQSMVVVKDIQTKLPVPFVSCITNGQLMVSNEQGIIHLTSLPDSIELIAMGYQNKIVRKEQLQPNSIVYLNTKVFILKQAIIKPVNPVDLIRKSHLLADSNHLPATAFYQKAFMRESYYESNHLMRLAENGLRIYQYRKANDEDKRKYFQYGSIALLEKSRHANDSITYEKIIEVVGKKWSKPLFNRFSAIGYVKGVNLLNMIYTYCLEEDKDRSLEYKGLVDHEGVKAYYIEIHETKQKQRYQTSKLYLHAQNLAVLSFEVNATEGLDKVNLLGLKERILAWIFGVKFKIHRYYIRINFKESQHKYVLSDAVYFLPIEFYRYGKKLIGYSTMQYKVDPHWTSTPFPDKNAVINLNKEFRGTHTYQFESKEWKGYPYFPINRDQLQLIEETKQRNSQFLLNKAENEK